MTYHFRKSLQVQGLSKTSQDFDADSLPGAKKIARKTWCRMAATHPGNLVVLRLYRRSAWSLSDNSEPGEVIAALSGHHGEEPKWTKVPPEDKQ